MIAVLLYRDTENTLGIPGEYPAETRPLKEGEDVQAPWIKMEEPALRELLQSLSPQVDAIFKSRADSEKASEAQKLDALKRLFDEAEAIDDAWATATNAQKFELCRTTFKILRRQRRQILDQYRPE